MPLYNFLQNYWQSYMYISIDLSALLKVQIMLYINQSGSDDFLSLFLNLEMFPIVSATTRLNIYFQQARGIMGKEHIV